MIPVVLVLESVERYGTATLEAAIASPKELSPQKSGTKAKRDLGVVSHERRRSEL
jgi:hypothetical protein